MRIQRTALVIASAAALAACGTATSSPTGPPTSAPTGSATSAPTVSPTSSPTPTSGSLVGTPSPAPSHASFDPLFVAFGDNQVAGGTLGNEKAVLMLANGAITAPMPSGPIVDGDATLAISGTFGARLIGTDGQPGWSSGPVSIVAVSSDGTITTLEKSVAGPPSVIGRDDGRAWAWTVQTNAPACGTSTGAAFDIYTDDGTGARKIGSASFGAGITLVSLVAWTAAGIVASGDNNCGAFDNSDVAVSPAILINPATGAATGLASRIGPNCSYQDIADDGTIACSVGGASQGIRFIAADGTQTKYSIPGMTSPSCLNGVALSADASFAAVSISCPATAAGAQLVLIDLSSGHVLVVPGNSELAPTLWTPDDVLIAADYGGERTFSVTPWGLTTLISAKYAVQTGVGV